MFAKSYHLHWIAGRANILLWIYNIHIFSILGVAFALPFLCYFQKLQLLVVKKKWNNFCCITLVFVQAQKLCLRFLKSYLKLEILIFLSFVVSFSRYVQLKSSFSRRKKHQQWNLRHTLVEKISKINLGNY